MDIEGRFWKIVIHLNSSTARVALIFLKREVDKARLQFRRIRQDRDEVEKFTGLFTNRKNSHGFLRVQQRSNEAMLALFADIHFLLICLDKIDLLLRMLQKHLPTNQKLNNILQLHSKSLKNYNDFRNHLEHINERIENKVSDLGNLQNNMFTFAGKNFDIGPDTENEVEKILDETLSALEDLN